MVRLNVSKKTFVCFFCGKGSLFKWAFHFGHISIVEVPSSRPPIDQANPFAYSCMFTLHISYTIGMLDQRGKTVKMFKTISIKVY